MSVVATTWCGQSSRARRRRRALDRARTLHRRPRRKARHAARRHSALAARACADRRISDVDAARAAPGVVAVVTGDEVTALSASLAVGVKAPIECWPIAVGRVRYVGEPVAVVVAADRYLAEDALDLIEVDYEPLPAVIDPLAALDPTRRCCMRFCAAMSPANAASATAIPSRPSQGRAPHRASPCTIRAIPARRSKPTASSPNTIPAKTPTTCWRISWGLSACRRACRGR